MKILSTRIRWAALAVALFGIELLIATVFAKVPFVRTDLGDYLVVILLYAIAKSIRDWPARPLAATILLFSFAVETAQGFHIADRLGFARGSIMSIIIGTTFQTSDLLMYLLGCLTAWRLDVGVMGKAHSPSSRTRSHDS